MHDARAKTRSNTMPRIAAAGVGAAIVAGWLAMSAQFIDTGALKDDVLGARLVSPAEASVPVRTAALIPAAELGNPARMPVVAPAVSEARTQPAVLSQADFAGRFGKAGQEDKTLAVSKSDRGAAIDVASLQPRAERFGAAIGSTKLAPVAPAIKAEAPAVAATVAVIEPVVTVPEPSNALLAVVESLPSVASMIERAEPREQAKPVESQPKRTKVLAYAAPNLEKEEKESGGGGLLAKLFNGNTASNGGLSLRRKGVAIYDISTATVHMPDGQKLEAHSGLGHMKDNPKYYDRRMNGPTPPNVYNLRMRESRYYGVEAIRMLPTDHKAMKGRNGILAHTSLVRGTNGSHGCVAFKDYNKFLKAFKRGEVTKMVVVPRMSEAKTYLASL